MNELHLSWYEMFMLYYCLNRAKSEWLSDGDQDEATKLYECIGKFMEANDDTEVFTIKVAE
jgi:hypothetical protein